MAKESVFDLEELKECLGLVEDPRVVGRTQHNFIDIVVLSVCAMLCGAEGCTEIESFGEQKEEWLRQYLELPNGIPSHDTIGRVLSLIEPEQFEVAFSEWVGAMANENGLSTKRISIDGKSAAGTERRFRKHPLHMVSAYSHELGLTLMQTEAKYRGMGEVEGALDCIKALELKGVTVMADAALSVERVVKEITDRGGHYLLPIKGNQKLTKCEMATSFESQTKKVEQTSKLEKHHGRSEKRTAEILRVGEMSEAFTTRWVNAQTLIRITRYREVETSSDTIRAEAADGRFSFEKRPTNKITREDVTYYLTDLKLTAKEALKEVRAHWAIENKCHWHLDVAFNEDNWRTRAKVLARALTLIRKMALNIVKASNTKGSIKGRMKKAGWNNEFLKELVFGQ